MSICQNILQAKIFNGGKYCNKFKVGLCCDMHVISSDENIC